MIDDFEILGKALAEFLVSNLIPQLDRADFKTTIVIVGRDDMKDSHIGFQHHHTNKIVGSLRLEKLPIETAKMMLISAGYNPNEADQLASYTDGYPFLVSVLCETKDRSVTFYQRFYDRTTRWMSDVEKEWVIPLCYLGRVDLQTIPLVLPNIDASIVMDWFKREASLRDPDESYYVISPLIRKMICEYNARYVGSVEHEAIKNKAQASAKIQDDGVENLSL